MPIPLEMKKLRIAGFTEKGEARIVDETNRIVGYGELRLESYVEPEKGDVFDVELAVTWVPELTEPEDGEVDWDALPAVTPGAAARRWI